MDGEVVIVTGAARGIGRWVARTFAEAGARVAGADLLPLDATSAELQKLEATFLPVQVDVRDEGAVASAMRTVADHYGRIDVLVNIAGIATHAEWEPHWPRIRDMEKSFFDQIVDTNLGGTFLCTKHVLPYMERQRAGHVLNTTGGGRLIPHGACVYVASKDAVRTFSRFVAEEEREHNVCVVAVGPGGAIATQDAPAEVRRRMPGVESVGTGYVQAAQLGMEMSGKQFTIIDGQLTVVT